MLRKLIALVPTLVLVLTLLAAALVLAQQELPKDVNAVGQSAT